MCDIAGECVPGLGEWNGLCYQLWVWCRGRWSELECGVQLVFVCVILQGSVYQAEGNGMVCAISCGDGVGAVA